MAVYPTVDEYNYAEKEDKFVISLSVHGSVGDVLRYTRIFIVLYWVFLRT